MAIAVQEQNHDHAVVMVPKTNSHSVARLRISYADMRWCVWTTVTSQGNMNGQHSNYGAMAMSMAAC